MNTVKTMAHEQQERLRSALTAGGAIEGPELPAGAYFLIRSEGSVVIAYRSGKVLFQGHDCGRQVRLAEEILAHAKPASKSLEFPIVGGDESGKGDLFGPLVVAAFAARGESERREVVRAGARDCKLMTDAEVRAVATSLDGIGVSAIRVLMPQEYNSRYARVHNVNVLLNEVYAELLLELATASKAQTVILDKYGGRAMVLWKTPQSFCFVVETHAERYPEVAAASVLARAAFLDGLERTARDNGVVRLPKGASMEAQAFMRRLASDKGKDMLRSVAKVNFAPVKACLDSLF
jgi:ribonuclease HIII